ncbi:MAG TPA: hypothetical protein VJV74_04010 [Terriglobia bacterium]|nr:hypothetical protein [Terriglobia bacterium]
MNSSTWTYGTHVSEVDWLAAQVEDARSFNPPDGSSIGISTEER